MSNSSEMAEDGVNHMLCTVTEMSAVLSLMNCRTQHFDASREDWSDMDDLVDDVDSRLDTAQHDWDKFKGHYNELKSEDFE